MAAKGKAFDSARLRYLDTASNCLMQTSPATAAYLGIMRRSLEDEVDRDTIDSSNERVCTTCGSLLIPGVSCEYAKTSRKRTRHDRIADSQNPVKVMKFRCNACDAITAIETVRHTKTGHGKLPDQIDSRLNDHTAVIPGREVEQTAKPTSRRRQKNKKASLQSILEQQKATRSNPMNKFGLDLTDLMKP